MMQTFCSFLAPHAQVKPYWAVTYCPDNFQPLPSMVQDAAQELGQCSGFSEVPDKYQCRPQGLSGSLAGFDDCWKCPPKARLPLVFLFLGVWVPCLLAR